MSRKSILEIILVVSIQRDLGLKGTEGSLKLDTMHGENSIPAQEVKGLVVQKLDKDAVVELLKAYSREAIPARINQIPTPEIASKWSHLEMIKDKIPPMQNKTKLGWGIIGPVKSFFPGQPGNRHL